MSTHAHTHALVIQDSTHQNTHDGNMWHVWVKNADNSQVGDNGTQNIVIDLSATTAGESVHMMWEVEAGGDAEVQLWEAITYESGSAFTPYNMNRSSAAAFNGVVKTGATVTTTSATQLDGVWVPGGARQQAVGGANRGGSEWVLMWGKKYAVISINRAGASKDMSLSITMYED